MSTIPIQQLDALMNIDNVYGMDEIIGDPIHALQPQETPISPPQSSTSQKWKLIGLLLLTILFVVLFAKTSFSTHFIK